MPDHTDPLPDHDCEVQHRKDREQAKRAILLARQQKEEAAQEALDREFRRQALVRWEEAEQKRLELKAICDHASVMAHQAGHWAAQRSEKILALCTRNAHEAKIIEQEMAQRQQRKEEEQKLKEHKRKQEQDKERARVQKVESEQQRRAARMASLNAAVEIAAVASTRGGGKIASIPVL